MLRNRQERTESRPKGNWKTDHVSFVCLPDSLSLFLRLSLNLYQPDFSACFPSMCLSAVSQSLKQSVSKAVSRFVPVWLKHYLRGFATLFLKRSDILSQPPPLPTGKLKMPQSPQATRFIYLHTYWVRETERDGGEGDLSLFCLSFLLHTLNNFLYKFAWYANSCHIKKKREKRVLGPQCSNPDL